MSKGLENIGTSYLNYQNCFSLIFRAGANLQEHLYISYLKKERKLMFRPKEFSSLSS